MMPLTMAQPVKLFERDGKAIEQLKLPPTSSTVCTLWLWLSRST